MKGMASVLMKPVPKKKITGFKPAGFLKGLVLGFSRLPQNNASLWRKRRSGISAFYEEGIYSQIWITLTSGKFLTDLALFLGSSAFHLGLINAIPFLAAPAQLLGAFLIHRSGSRKTVLLPSAFISRQIWWLILILILLPIDSMYKIWIFILLFAACHVSGQIAGNAWMDWLGVLIPDDMRGRVVAFRNGILIFVALLADFLLSQIREDLGSSLRWLFLVLCLLAASLSGLKSVMAFKNQWEPPGKPETPPRFGAVLKQFFSHKPIRRLLLALVTWNIAVGVAISFWAPHMIMYLHLSFTTIFFYSAIVTLGNFFMSRYIWGDVIDRSGNVPVVLLCTIAISCIPFFWFLITPDKLTFLWIEALLNGLAWSGFNVGIFNLPYVILPRKNRSYFFAILAALSGLTLGMGAIMGGVIAQICRDMQIEILGFTVINYHVTFLLSGILRWCCVFLMKGIPESHSRGMVHMLRAVGDGLVRLRTNPRLLFVNAAPVIRRPPRKRKKNRKSRRRRIPARKDSDS